MNFNWNDFDKKGFEIACEMLKENDDNEDFVGSVRVGNLCFDVVTREYNDKLYLDYDLYVGGVDTGYGYADDYPYDYAGGGSFDESCVEMNYEEFKAHAEETMENYINDEETAYIHASLIKKANEELKVW